MSSHEIDTIVLGVPCTIRYDYQPYEPAERGPEAQYPGCPEDIDIVDVLVGGVSVLEWFEDALDMFEEAVASHLDYQREQFLESKAEARYDAYEEGWES